MNTRPCFIAVDWGTTNCRAYLVDTNLNCLEGPVCGAGLLDRDGKEFSALLHDSIGAWRAKESDIPVVLTGMIGSSLGWREVPFVPCPAGAEQIGASLHFLDDADWRNTCIVPGLTAISTSGNVDVLRGEECQALGAASLLHGESFAGSMTVCLPGTHSKWVSIDQGKIMSFSTYMTGELYDVLRRHSILSQSVDESGEIDEGAFVLGLECSGQPGGLLHHLFSVRSRNLEGSLKPSEGASYLSGLLIGREVIAQVLEKNTPVTVVGSETMLLLYGLALAHFGLSTVAVSAQDATIRGVNEILRCRAQ